MSGTAHGGGADGKGQQLLFWGCFIALVTTAFGFIGRMFLINTWAAEFDLEPAQAGRLAGIGIWPFAVSIIGFSLLIDKIGYKVSMIIAFIGHATWAVMGVCAYHVGQSGDEGSKEAAFQLLYWGSLVLALGNGTVEAFINPVVATIFNREKTKWLNILHAGWPGGLVVAGIITIFLGDIEWQYKVGMIAVPAVVYLLMLLPCRFPVQERVASGVSYRQMLSEFGILGALVVGFLVTLQLMDFYSGGDTSKLSGAAKGTFIGIGAVIVIAFGVYTKSMGRFLLFFLILIMMPLATTEIGTDGWITAIMEGALLDKETGELVFNPGWVLVYTSAIMMVLRFFAGPIVHSLSPLGLLATSAVLAIIGLWLLSSATGLGMIFLSASIYALGKTFFWPTMLGVVSEQTPRGGALTLNAISGIGMLAVGTLGFPLIGVLQTNKQIAALEGSTEIVAAAPSLFTDGKLTATKEAAVYEIIKYQAIDDAKVNAAVATRPAVAKEIKDVRDRSNQGALKDMTFFPAIMLGAYLLLILYFSSKGGYKATHLADGGGGEHG